MRTPDPKIDRLRLVPGLAGCDRRELERLAACCDLASLAPGHVLIREDQSGFEVFAIVEGSVVVTRGGEYLASLGVGAVCGELAVLGRAPRTATVTAETAVEVLVFDRAAFDRLLSTGAVSNRLLEKLAGAARHAMVAGER